MSKVSYLRDIVLGGDADDELRDILRNSFLDTDIESKWLPVKVQLVVNKALQARYDEKRQDFIVRGRSAEEISDQFGFIVENHIPSLDALCSAGLECRDSEYNALGYNCMGVYVCRHVDVALQHALVKYSASSVVRLVICKYMMGRQTTAIPRVASAADFISPTQGFDSHCSVIAPQATDSLQNQFDRSQVYIYEINKILQPSTHPRQVVPYAVITFTPDGQHNPSVDSAPTELHEAPQSPSMTTGKSKLQQIIDEINSRGEGGATGACPALIGGRREVGAAPSQPIGPFRKGGGERGRQDEGDDTGGLHGGEGSGKGAGNNSVEGMTDTQKLQMAINQVKARLESEEQNKLNTIGASVPRLLSPRGVPSHGGPMLSSSTWPSSGRGRGGMYIQGNRFASPASSNMGGGGVGGMMSLVATSNGNLIRVPVSAPHMSFPMVRTPAQAQARLGMAQATMQSVPQQQFIHPYVSSALAVGNVSGMTVSHAPSSQTELNAALVSGGYFTMPGTAGNFEFDFSSGVVPAASPYAPYQAIGGLNQGIGSVNQAVSVAEMNQAMLNGFCLDSSSFTGVSTGIDPSMYQRMELLQGGMLTPTAAAAIAARDKAAAALGATPVGQGYYSMISPSGAVTPARYTLVSQGVKRSFNDIAGVGLATYGTGVLDKRPRYL